MEGQIFNKDEIQKKKKYYTVSSVSENVVSKRQELLQAISDDEITSVPDIESPLFPVLYHKW